MHVTRRAIIHIGVFKTGTTTTQACLELNRDKFANDFTLILGPQTHSANRSARKFSKSRKASQLIDFEQRFEATIQEWIENNDTNLVLSCEGLMGLPPGREWVKDFSAAPILIEIMDKVFRRQSIPIEHEFIMSLRDQMRWEASLYWHNVRVCEMNLSLEDFRKNYGEPSKLLEVFETLKNQIPDSKLSYYMLEDTKNLPLGPAEPIFARMYPDDEMHETFLPAQNMNERKSQTYLDQCLEINRQTDISSRERKLLKNDLLKLFDQ